MTNPMTPTEQDKELRDKLTKLISQDGWVDPYEVDVDGQVNELVAIITADRKRVALEARIDPFDFVESCEPDCDDVRHAYHQGQWDMATRIEAQLEEV